MAMTCDPYSPIRTPFTHHDVSKERVTFTLVNFKRTQQNHSWLLHFFATIQRNLGIHLVDTFFESEDVTELWWLVTCIVATRMAIYRLVVCRPPMLIPCARPLTPRMFIESVIMVSRHLQTWYRQVVVQVLNLDSGVEWCMTHSCHHQVLINFCRSIYHH